MKYNLGLIITLALAEIGYMFTTPTPSRLLVIYIILALIVVLLAILICQMIYWAFQKWRKPLIFIRGRLAPAQFNDCFTLGEGIYRRLRKPYPAQDQANGWLENYGCGVFEAYDREEKCWGYLSLWPLDPAAFEGIRAGAITEAQLAQPMIAEAKNAPFAHWYVADILKRNKRFHEAVPNPTFSEYLCSLMIYHGLRSLLKAKQFRFPFAMVGCAVTRPGKDWLERLNFEPVPLAPMFRHAGNIYSRSIDRKGLKNLLKRMRGEIKSHEARINNLIRAYDRT